jgi:hypothetical protein
MTYTNYSIKETIQNTYKINLILILDDINYNSKLFTKKILFLRRVFFNPELSVGF